MWTTAPEVGDGAASGGVGRGVVGQNQARDLDLVGLEDVDGEEMGEAVAVAMTMGMIMTVTTFVLSRPTRIVPVAVLVGSGGRAGGGAAGRGRQVVKDGIVLGAQIAAQNVYQHIGTAHDDGMRLGGKERVVEGEFRGGGSSNRPLLLLFLVLMVFLPFPLFLLL